MKIFFRFADLALQSKIMALCAASNYEITQNVSLADILITDSLKTSTSMAERFKKVILVDKEDFYLPYIERYYPNLNKKISVVVYEGDDIEDEILRILAQTWFELRT